jgi:hypothetical protein
MEQMMECLLARMDANIKTRQENTMKEMRAGQDLNVSLLSRIEANQRETKEIHAIRSELENTRKETMACQGKTEASLEWERRTSVDMEPDVAYQEVPKEGAEVMPVGGPKKRRRDRNLAAGRRQKPKKTT